MPYLDANGHRFHYYIDDYTDPWRTVETVLLHHAAAGNLHRWRAWVPALARHYRVLRFDIRSHGRTPPPPGGQFSLPELAADIAAVMDSLEIDKAHLVGASAGGIISLRFAHDFPLRLHSLTLVAATPGLGPV
jgi:3-oxoadipate enol-lactonase